MRRVTITVEGDGPGADTALARLVEALRLAVAPDDRRPPDTPAPRDREAA